MESETAMNDSRPVDRRDFLRSVACGTLSAGSILVANAATAGPAKSAAPFPSSTEAEEDRVFPQGIASGDPVPDGFLLWARVPTGAPVPVAFQVGDSESFENIVREGSFTAEPDSDGTVRIRVRGLDPHKRYWYRFRANNVSSPIGRTCTAPLPDDPVPVRLANSKSTVSPCLPL